MRGKDWAGRSHRFCRACCLRQKPKLLLLPLAAGQAPYVPVNNSNKEASQAGLQGLGIDLMLRFSVCVCFCWYKTPKPFPKFGMEDPLEGSPNNHKEALKCAELWRLQ